MDDALTLSNPRLLGSVYFGLLALIAAIAIQVFLNNLGVELLLPPFKAVLLSTLIASVFGALFAKKIAHCTVPYRLKAFLWGFLLVVTALPVYDLMFLYLTREHYNLIHATPTYSSLLYRFLLIWSYNFVLAGLWLAIGAGFAALYLRGHLIYLILQRPPVRENDKKKNRTVKNNADDHR